MTCYIDATGLRQTTKLRQATVLRRASFNATPSYGATKHKYDNSNCLRGQVSSESGVHRFREIQESRYEGKERRKYKKVAGSHTSDT